MDPTEVKPSDSEGPSSSVVKTVDLISKSVAAFAIVLYGCGFLITSIHQSSFGFTETNPLRPRIASAGAWLILFLVIPIAFETENRNLRGKTESQHRWLRRFSTIIFFDCALSMFFGGCFSTVFEPGSGNGGSSSIFTFWTATMVLAATGVLVVLDQRERFPRAIAPIASLTLTGFLTVYGFREAFFYRRIDQGSIMLWFLYAGLIFKPMGFSGLGGWSSSWKLWVDGSWPQNISLAITGLFLFASFYYPHIKSAWGGGPPNL